MNEDDNEALHDALKGALASVSTEEDIGGIPQLIEDDGQILVELYWINLLTSQIFQTFFPIKIAFKLENYFI